MSLHRVLQRLARRVTKHERGDGHEPTAEAHRVFLEHAREDFAAVQLAINAGAELDRLRALPVIATCGECGWARDGGHSYDGPLVVCGKITHDSLGRRQTMSVADEPPTWCPLRGGGR